MAATWRLNLVDSQNYCRALLAVSWSPSGTGGVSIALSPGVRTHRVASGLLASGAYPEGSAMTERRCATRPRACPRPRDGQVQGVELTSPSTMNEMRSE